jgi:hypothetical protein
VAKEGRAGERPSFRFQEFHFFSRLFWCWKAMEGDEKKRKRDCSVSSEEVIKRSKYFLDKPTPPLAPVSAVTAVKEPAAKTGDIIPGLIYKPNFLTAAEASELLKNIDAKPWSNELKRRVQHYGALFHFFFNSCFFYFSSHLFPFFFSLLSFRSTELQATNMTTNPRNFPTKLSQSLSFVVSLLSD